MRIFATRLTELRKEKGLSKLSLSKILEVDDASVGRWETASSDITSDNLIKLAKFFDTSTDYLLGLSDDY